MISLQLLFLCAFSSLVVYGVAGQNMHKLLDLVGAKYERDSFRTLGNALNIAASKHAKGSITNEQLHDVVIAGISEARGLFEMVRASSRPPLMEPMQMILDDWSSLIKDRQTPGTILGALNDLREIVPIIKESFVEGEYQILADKVTISPHDIIEAQKHGEKVWLDMKTQVPRHALSKAIIQQTAHQPARVLTAFLNHGYPVHSQMKALVEYSIQLEEGKAFNLLLTSLAAVDTKIIKQNEWLMNALEKKMNVEPSINEIIYNVFNNIDSLGDDHFYWFCLANKYKLNIDNAITALFLYGSDNMAMFLAQKYGLLLDNQYRIATSLLAMNGDAKKFLSLSRLEPFFLNSPLQEVCFDYQNYYPYFATGKQSNIGHKDFLQNHKTENNAIASPHFYKMEIVKYAKIIKSARSTGISIVERISQGNYRNSAFPKIRSRVRTALFSKKEQLNMETAEETPINELKARREILAKRYLDLRSSVRDLLVFCKEIGFKDDRDQSFLAKHLQIDVEAEVATEIVSCVLKGNYDSGLKLSLEAIKRQWDCKEELLAVLNHMATDVELHRYLKKFQQQPAILNLLSDLEKEQLFNAEDSSVDNYAPLSHVFDALNGVKKNFFDKRIEAIAPRRQGSHFETSRHAVRNVRLPPYKLNHVPRNGAADFARNNRRLII
jgi:hypothetical protein